MFRGAVPDDVVADGHVPWSVRTGPVRHADGVTRIPELVPLDQGVPSTHVDDDCGTRRAGGSRDEAVNPIVADGDVGARLDVDRILLTPGRIGAVEVGVLDERAVRRRLGPVLVLVDLHSISVAAEGGQVPDRGLLNPVSCHYRVEIDTVGVAVLMQPLVVDCQILQQGVRGTAFPFDAGDADPLQTSHPAIDIETAQNDPLGRSAHLELTCCVLGPALAVVHDSQILECPEGGLHLQCDPADVIPDQFHTSLTPYRNACIRLSVSMTFSRRDHESPHVASGSDLQQVAGRESEQSGSESVERACPSG